MSDRVTLYEDGDILAQGDITEGMFFVHCTMKNFSKSALKRARAVFKEIKEQAWLEGFDQLYSCTPKPHFARHIDSEFSHITTVFHEGTRNEVIVWELKQPS